MKFVSRAQWGAAYAKGSGPIPGPVLGVTCHWEGPHMGPFGHVECARKVRVIERFHATVRDWAGIAYNLVACPHGYVFEGRGAGVRSAANGTSSIGGNDRWYAVCYLGGVGDGFTTEGRTAMGDAIAYLRGRGAGPGVNGHRDHHATECPGNEIYAWAHGDQLDTPSPQEDDDMAFNDWFPTKAEFGDFITRQVLKAKVALINPDGTRTEWYVEAILRKLDAQQAANARALAAIADGPAQGLTPEQIQQAVHDALESGVVDVDINVNQKEG